MKYLQISRAQPFLPLSILLLLSFRVKILFANLQLSCAHDSLLLSIIPLLLDWVKISFGDHENLCFEVFMLHNRKLDYYLI